jgi:hypothetical protein
VPSRLTATRPRGSVTSWVTTAAVEIAACFFVTPCGLVLVCRGWSCRVHNLCMRILWFIFLYPVDTESRILRKHRHISTRLHGIIIQTLGIFSSFEVFRTLISTFLQTSRFLCSGTQNNIPEEGSYFPVWSIISDMFVPVLCHHRGNHCCAAWAVVNAQLPKNVSLFIWIFYFFFVALRPNVGHGLIPDVSRSHTTTHHSR